MFEQILNDKPAVFLASDLHLGAPNREASALREKHFVHWLDHIKPQAAALILLGDIFDFWFEYKHVIPKGFIRIQGKLAEWKDAGIPIYIFTGNHDIWMKEYFTQELGIPVFHHPVNATIKGHICHLAHGDGLGPGDHGFKWMKRIFTNPFAQWAYAWLHPDIGIPLAQYFSGSSRKAHVAKDAIHFGEQEFLFQYTLQQATVQPETRYFIFGHRHRPEIIKMPSNQKMINLGDWIQHFSFAVIEEEGVSLCQFTLDGSVQTLAT